MEDGHRRVGKQGLDVWWPGAEGQPPRTPGRSGMKPTPRETAMARMNKKSQRSIRVESVSCVQEVRR